MKVIETPICEDCNCKMEYRTDKGFYMCPLCGQSTNNKSDCEGKPSYVG